VTIVGLAIFLLITDYWLLVTNSGGPQGLGKIPGAGFFLEEFKKLIDLDKRGADGAP